MGSMLPYIAYMDIMDPMGNGRLQLWPKIPVISTYNPIYKMYNPSYNQLQLINGHNCKGQGYQKPEMAAEEAVSHARE